MSPRGNPVGRVPRAAGGTEPAARGCPRNWSLTRGFIRTKSLVDRHAQTQPDADPPGARDHEGGVVARPRDRPRRLRGSPRGAEDRLHHGHDHDERAREEGAPPEEGRGPLLPLPADPTAAPGGGLDGARVRPAGLRRLGRAAPGPPRGRGAPDPRGARRARQADRRRSDEQRPRARPAQPRRLERPGRRPGPRGRGPVAAPARRAARRPARPRPGAPRPRARPAARAALARHGGGGELVLRSRAVRRSRRVRAAPGALPPPATPAWPTAVAGVLLARRGPPPHPARRRPRAPALAAPKRPAPGRAPVAPRPARRGRAARPLPPLRRDEHPGDVRLPPAGRPASPRVRVDGPRDARRPSPSTSSCTPAGPTGWLSCWRTS